MLTQEYVQDKFNYDPETGRLQVLKGWGREDFNSKYPRIYIDGVRHYSHRIIWLYVYGYMPVGIDHIDGDPRNNRLSNLREATQTQNQGNAFHGKMRGIQRHGQKWRVRITGTDWKIELGSYLTLEEAIAARDAGHRKYFGEFARAA